MGTIHELNKEMDKLERQKAFDDFVKEKMEDNSIFEAYHGLHVPLRESAEEWFDTIRDRQMAVRRVIRSLMNKYW